MTGACDRGPADKATKTSNRPSDASLALVASGGSADPIAATERKWSRPDRAAECDRLLRDLCGERMCATFDDARAALVTRKSTTCLAGELGSCDAGKFVDYASSFDAISVTYDAKGTLVSLEARGGAAAECTIGPKRACAAKPSDSFCPPRPIAEHCSGACPTLMETMSRLGTEGGCPPGANIDRLPCGTYVVVDERHGEASITRTFDAKGKLVAAQATNPEVKASMRWGEAPTCTTGAAEPLCPAPAASKASPKKRRK